MPKRQQVRGPQLCSSLILHQQAVKPAAFDGPVHRDNGHVVELVAQEQRFAALHLRRDHDKTFNVAAQHAARLFVFGLRIFV
jgi:hypothetical protein